MQKTGYGVFRRHSLVSVLLEENGVIIAKRREIGKKIEKGRKTSKWL